MLMIPVVNRVIEEYIDDALLLQMGKPKSIFRPKVTEGDLREHIERSLLRPFRGWRIKRQLMTNFFNYLHSADEAHVREVLNLALTEPQEYAALVAKFESGGSPAPVFASRGDYVARPLRAAEET